jgi:hypothetical protein
MADAVNCLTPVTTATFGEAADAGRDPVEGRLGHSWINGKGGVSPPRGLRRSVSGGVLDDGRPLRECPGTSAVDATGHETAHMNIDAYHCNMILAWCRRGVGSGWRRMGNERHGRRQTDSEAETKIISVPVGSPWAPRPAV